MKDIDKSIDRLKYVDMVSHWLYNVPYDNQQHQDSFYVVEIDDTFH